MPIPMLLSIVLALAPLDAGQEARLAAWLQWAAAYRECYEPAPFSLRLDQTFTAHCIEDTLRREEPAGPPEQRAATEALIAATPQLITLLNAPVGEVGNGKKAARVDPLPSPAHH
jgi:hypothetical protein